MIHQASKRGRNGLAGLLAKALIAMATATLSIVPSAAAQTGKVLDAKDLFAMPLEDLMQVQVYTSVRQAEAHQAASSSITSYSREQLRYYGRYTIEELAAITPGYYVTQARDKGLATRGLSADPLENNRHLLLIDEIPVRHARGRRMPMQSGFPLFFAETVEFLRGPASALYGSGAMNGVVNVRPQEYEESDAGLEIRGTSGTLDNALQAMANAHITSRAGTTSVSLGAFNKDASNERIDPENFPAWRLNDRQESTFVFARHRVSEGLAKGITLGFLYSNLFNGLPGGLARQQHQNFPSDETRWQIVLPYVKLTRSLLDTVHLSSYFTYNRSIETGSVTEDSTVGSTPTDVESRYRSTTEAYEGQATLRFDLLEDTNLVIGGNLDYRREFGPPQSYAQRIRNGQVEPRPASFARTTPWFREWAAFAQLRHRFDLLSGTFLTAGMRYTDVDAAGLKSDNLSPRISLVQQLTDEWVVRLLWHTAFRSPNIKEASLNRNPNPPFNITHNLKPELLTTYEGGVGYTTSNLDLQFNVFFNQIDDAITRTIVVRNGTPSPRFVNLHDETRSWGGEFIATARLSEGWTVTGSYAYNRPSGAGGRGLRQILPRHSGSMTATFSDTVFGRLYTVAAVNQWAHGFSPISDRRQDVGTQFRVDLNGRLALTPSVILELQARNVFDRKDRTPLAADVGLPSPGFSLLGSVVVYYDHNF